MYVYIRLSKARFEAKIYTKTETSFRNRDDLYNQKLRFDLNSSLSKYFDGTFYVTYVNIPGYCICIGNLLLFGSNYDIRNAHVQT